MVKSKPKFIYGIDEPGRLSKGKLDSFGYLLVRKARNGKKSYLADCYNDKFIWDYDPNLEFYEHSVDKLLKFFKKNSESEYFREEIKFLEIEVKKSFYEDLLNDEK